MFVPNKQQWADTWLQQLLTAGPCTVVACTDSITAANEANTAKEKALAEASALKLAAEREHAAFEEEWRQLTHLIEDDRYAQTSSASA